jgi:serine/threonine-protein kinase
MRAQGELEFDAGTCLDEDQILAFARNEGSPSMLADLERHLDACPGCFDVVANAVRVNFGASPALAETIIEGNVDRGASPVPAGTRYLGRYELVEPVGAGGMGVVYRAYDPALRRYVALKLIRSDGHLASLAASLRVRLLREAHAMARLTHPNIVTVFDVGFVESQIFVAMEFIDGPTLHAWQAAAPRSWREIVANYVEAAKGLLAAHECGIVHRDFKPDNVLFSGTRVVVTDFGVAVSIRRDGDPTSDGPSYAGTPAYMAPEQFRGDPADARTDIFNFCAALYEALYGEPAFFGNDFLSRRKAVLSGKIRPAPAKTRVPAWIRRVLLRGLATDAEKRPQSMATLIHALQPDARLRRTRAAASLMTMMLLVGGASAAVTSYRSPLTACRRQASALGGIWSPENKRQVQSAFARSGLPYQAQTWGIVEKTLDDYVGRWAGGYERACEAAHRDGTQSAETLDLRLTCLDERKISFAKLRDVLAGGETDVINRAINAVMQLEPVDACDDVAALRAVTPLAVAAIERKPMRDARMKLAEARALFTAAKYAEARRLSDEALAAARSAGHAPMISEALFRLGTISTVEFKFKQGEKELREAIDFAERGRADLLRARIATHLVDTVGVRLKRHPEGDDWLHQAEVVLERAGNPAVDVANLVHSRGNLEIDEEKFDAAENSYRHALELRRKLLPPNHPAIGMALINLGMTLFAKGRYHDARTIYAAAFDQMSASLGADHPNLYRIWERIGISSYAEHYYKAALDAYRRALAFEQRSFGPRNARVGITLSNIAEAMNDAGDHEQSIDTSKTALEILRAGHGDAQMVAQAQTTLATALSAMGRFEEARAIIDQAVAALVKDRGPDSDTVTEARFDLARVYMDAHRYVEALPILREALPRMEAARGANHPLVADILDAMGESERRLGRAVDALEHHRRALAIRTAAGATGGVAATLTELGLAQLDSRAEVDARATLERALTERTSREDDAQATALTQFALARALTVTRGDADRSKTLALAAQSAYERGGARWKAEAQEVRLWLHRHGKSKY